MSPERKRPHLPRNRLDLAVQRSQAAITGHPTFPGKDTMMRTGGRARPPAWALYLSVYLAGLVPYMFIPEGPVMFVYFQVFAWSGVAMMAGRLLWKRPARPGALWLLTACGAGTALGVLVFFLSPLSAKPGLPDVFYLLSGFSGIAGMVLLVRRRAPGRNRENFLDAAIISCGFALLACVFLVKPAVAVAGSAVGAVVAAAYPVIDLFGLALLVGLLLSGGLRNSSIRLIALAQLTFLISDTAWAFIPAGQFQNPLVLHAMTACSLLVYGLFGTAALHPGFTRITIAPASTGPDMPWLRTPLLLIAVMAGPALLLFEAWKYQSGVPDAVIIASGSIVIFGLVVARLQFLVARVSSQSVILTEQAEQMRFLASHDSLTGLINRREWDTTLADGLAQAHRFNLTTTVAIIDLDHFKRYNDRHGHQAGDQLLKAAAVAWTAELRKLDLLARYGGEEFIALLPGCSTAEAVEVVQRLHDVTPDGQSFSAGIATWDLEETCDRLIARADSALYRAKNTGRNKSVIAENDSYGPALALKSHRSAATAGAR